MYVLDTDHWTILQLQSGIEFERLANRIKTQPDDEFFVSIVTFHEVMKGWLNYLAKARDPSGVVRGYQRFEFLLGRFSPAHVLAFSDAAAEIFAEMRANRVRVSTMELRIASIAIAGHMTVLTRNTVDFERVPGLSIEDWLA